MNLDDYDCETLDDLPSRSRQSIPAADRELLELAARALGAVRVEDVDGEEWVNLHFDDKPTMFGWNPLLHSDDTLILAVKLRISIDPTDDSVCAIVGRGQHVIIESATGAELVAATRRAVTRAAAEIGKQRS